MKQNLLILDLDETLVRAEKEPLSNAHDFAVGPYLIYCRPHLEEFLQFCLSSFRVAIWSSASDEYVHEIAKRLFPCNELLFVWGASRVTYVRTLHHHNEKYGFDLGFYHNQKRLKKVSKKFDWSLDQILIVDDSPEKSAQNYGNVIHPTPFFGDPGDRELPLLASYLETLAAETNMREIEKRSWRMNVEPKPWS